MRWIEANKYHDGKACLIWPFARAGTGYGQVSIEGVSVGAHRVMCESVNGPAPSREMIAAHSCGNGHLGCVHPAHLDWADNSSNQIDRVKHGRNGSLTESDVLDIRASARSDNNEALAKRFGVSPAAIRDVVAGRTWGWVAGVKARKEALK